MRPHLPSLTLASLGQYFLALTLALCPMVRINVAPAAGPVPVSAPSAPVEEHEHEEKPSGQSQSQSEEGALNRPDRRAVPPAAGPSPRSLHQKLTAHPGSALQRSSDLDPFRNGLGCPFRC